MEFLTRLRSSLFLFAFALSCSPACQVADVHAYNLRELHEEGGRHKRLAGLMNGTEYAFRDGLGGLFAGVREKLPKKAQVAVEDPLGACVENLIELSEFKSNDETIAALQVEYFARYAVYDPWQISRQICVRNLGAAGARLKLAEHPAQVSTAAVATPEAVRDALAPLIRAVAPSSSAQPASDLAAACLGMAQLNYDLDGVLRALPASAYLMRRESSGSKNRALLLELVLDLERRSVRMALERSLVDASPCVRALTLRALVTAEGPTYLARAMPRLGTETEPEVQFALLSMIRALGLPGAKSAPTGSDPAQSAREGELALVYRVATEHPVERVRVNAMETLGEISGSGFKSLREEDWQTWWHARTLPAAR